MAQLFEQLALEKLVDKVRHVRNADLIGRGGGGMQAERSHQQCGEGSVRTPVPSTIGEETSRHAARRSDIADRPEGKRRRRKVHAPTRIVHDGREHLIKTRHVDQAARARRRVINPSTSGWWTMRSEARRAASLKRARSSSSPSVRTASACAKAITGVPVGVHSGASNS